jgi:hypothetical protein
MSIVFARHFARSLDNSYSPGLAKGTEVSGSVRELPRKILGSSQFCHVYDELREYGR